MHIYLFRWTRYISCIKCPITALNHSSFPNKFAVNNINLHNHIPCFCLLITFMLILSENAWRWSNRDTCQHESVSFQATGINIINKKYKDCVGWSWRVHKLSDLRIIARMGKTPFILKGWWNHAHFKSTNLTTVTKIKYVRTLNGKKNYQVVIGSCFSQSVIKYWVLLNLTRF